MCGIAGVLNFRRHKSVDPAVLQTMCDVMRHRGPDDEGFYLEDNIGLGMRRLSIIDLFNGRQPIRNENSNVWAVFNGEIYNFRELRQDLSHRHHVFRTNADGEVIVHLYEEYGESFVEHLNGMFSIALWDKRNRKFMLTRDRFGIKPLFYFESAEELVFGSELKSVLVHPSCKTDIDLQALHDYLSFNYIPGPRTIFTAVRKLQPGYTLVVEDHRSTQYPYWDLKFEARGENWSEEDFVDELCKVLRKAVAGHLISDVPMGVFLSGGVDSSTLVALMAETSARPIKTFSVGFEEESFNELPVARQVAKRFATDHHELVVKPDAVNLLPRLVEAFDEPFADSSSIPVFYLSKLARGEVKTVLSGEGGDEVFAGYDTYGAARVARLYRKLHTLLRRHIIPAVVSRIPVSHKRVSFDYRAKRFVKGAELSPEEGHFWWKVVFTEDAKEELYGRTTEMLDNSFSVFRDRFTVCGSQDLLDRLQYVDTKVYLPDDILVKTDRMSMANSLEARVPFLDHELVEWVTTIPSALKINGLTKKYILKKAMAEHLPKEVTYGKKRGFNVPIPGWLRGELRDMVGDLLSPARIRKFGFFDSGYVSRMIEDHQAMRVDYSRNIWNLLVFALWCERCDRPEHNVRRSA